MNRRLLAPLLAGSLLVAPLAAAQVELQLTAPSIRFSVEPVVVPVVSGIWVVPDHPDEVFFTGGRYWTRKDKRWFYSHHHGGKWIKASGKHVPRGLSRLEPGKYRRYQAPHGASPVRASRARARHDRWDARGDDGGGKHRGKGKHQGKGKGKHQGGQKGKHKGKH